MEDIPVEQGFPECAEFEECRVRQSEFVNMQAVQAHQRLVALLGTDFTAAAASSNGSSMASAVASLPPEVVEALTRLVDAHEAEMADLVAAATVHETERENAVARAATLAQKAERLRDENRYLTERSSANLKEFRQHLSQSGEAARERNRELASLHRKREKAAMDLKRTEMEMERLRRISKGTK